jgi:hypothetical protein
VIVLQDFTDADATVKCSPLYDSDLPQFELPPICDGVNVPADPYAAYAQVVRQADAERESVKLANGQRVDSVGGVVLSDLAPGLASDSAATASAEGHSSLAPIALGADDDSDRAATRFERSLRRGSLGVRALLAGSAAAAVLVVGLVVSAHGPMASSTGSTDAAFALARAGEGRRPVTVSPEALSVALDGVGDGVLHTFTLPPGTEVYVDGALGGLAPQSLNVRCGVRIVDIGKTTAPRKVDVPCGGEATLSR